MQRPPLVLAVAVVGCLQMGCGEVLLFPDSGPTDVDAAHNTPDSAPVPDQTPPPDQAPPPDQTPPAVPDPDLSTVTANPTSGLFADGAASSVITITVRDADGTALANIPVVLSVVGGAVLSQPEDTGGDGRTIGSLTATVPGPKTVTATAGGVRLTQQAVITFDPRPIMFSFTGAVQSVTDNTAGGLPVIPIDALAAGSFRFLGATADTNPDPTIGVYPHTTTGFGVTLTIATPGGGRMFKTNDAMVDFTITVTDDTVDRYAFVSVHNTASVAGLTMDSITFDMEDPTGTQLPDDHLPLVAGDLAIGEWDQPLGLQIRGHNGAGTFVIVVILDDLF